ncbi:hypothetical protein JNJ66_02820 [Candidatus Saccharibacteria bacterium]|nr:hypothetical protein [Candidatus Saccharibacteria bacterium]
MLNLLRAVLLTALMAGLTAIGITPASAEVAPASAGYKVVSVTVTVSDSVCETGGYYGGGEKGAIITSAKLNIWPDAAPSRWGGKSRTILVHFPGGSGDYAAFVKAQCKGPSGKSYYVEDDSDFGIHGGRHIKVTIT